VSTFAATSPSYSSVTLTWLDNNGVQPATGFLILANKTGIFTPPPPADGTPVIDDYTLVDGSAAVNILPGAQTFSFYGLDSSTPYYFIIYPYTNAGANIDYKMGAPTANVTTLVYSAPVAAWTFDATPVAPDTPTSVPANIGAQAGTAYVYADGTNGSSSWITALTGNELTAFGGTTINDPREGVNILAGLTYSAVAGTAQAANGKTMVFKFSMTDLQSAVVTFATRGSGSGFNSQLWEWSTNGTTFTGFGSNTADNSQSFVLKTLDLTAITALDGAANVYLRVTFNGATSSTGNNRLDNVVIRALPYAIPVNRTVTGIVYAGQTPCYAASQTITVGPSFEVQANGYAHMIAGSKIIFVPGSKVNLNGKLLAQIVPGGIGCTAPEKSAAAPEETGIAMMNNSVKIYPNPTSGVFTIEQRGEAVTDHMKVEVMGTMGRTVLVADLQGLRKQQLSIKGNPTGIYFVKVTTGDKVQTVKIILTN
jgi:hypothetical protein